jgi:predicted DNA-binding protein
MHVASFSQSPRLNIRLPGEITAQLEVVAKITGRSKAQLIAEAVTHAMPDWRGQIDAFYKIQKGE